MAYKRDGVYQNKYISAGKNSCKYILLHHTGSIGAGNLKILSGQTDRKVSVHFLINRDGKAYKLAEPTNITWHAGESERGGLKGMNQYSIGIEIEGNKETPFTDIQYNKVVDVVKYLMKTFNIPKENIIRHCDVTRSGSKQMKLWDGVGAARKTDVDRRLRGDRGYKNFTERREKVLS